MKQYKTVIYFEAESQEEANKIAEELYYDCDSAVGSDGAIEDGEEE